MKTAPMHEYGKALVLEDVPDFHCGIPCGFPVASLCDIGEFWANFS